MLSDEVSESTSEEEEEPDATLFARDDLVINGTGRLVVEAKNQDGIKSKDNVTIVGGTISVTASDDGMNISGGNDQSGMGGRPGQGMFSGNGDGCLTLSGGTLIAAGSSGMLQYPDSSSGQCIAVLTFASMQAGTECVLRDASGTELASITPEKSFQSLVISLAELKQGETYSMEIGSEEIEVTFEDTVCVLSLQGGQTGGQNGGGMFGHGGGRGNRP